MRGCPARRAFTIRRRLAPHSIRTRQLSPWRYYPQGSLSSAARPDLRLEFLVTIKGEAFWSSQPVPDHLRRLFRPATPGRRRRATSPFRHRPRSTVSLPARPDSVVAICNLLRTCRLHSGTLLPATRPALADTANPRLATEGAKLNPPACIEAGTVPEYCAPRPRAQRLGARSFGRCPPSAATAPGRGKPRKCEEKA